MTPSEIRAARYIHRRDSGDLYGAVGLAKIIDRVREEQAIRVQCNEISILPAHLPEFISKGGYSWVTDPESYDVAAEAAFQRRALMMLAKLWVEAPNKSPLIHSISNIVVVQEFATKFGHCSPKIWQNNPGSNCRILSIPSAFVEFATWVFSGLRCWTSYELGWSEDRVGDGGWSMVCTPLPARMPKPFNHVVSYELIARTLAEAGRDLELHGDNAALLIREQVPELAGPTGDIEPTSLYDFDQNASYMAVEFAIAHELGHALLPSGHNPSEDQSSEAAAHRAGCTLLQLSAATRVFGWGENILPDVTQAAVGMILFRVLLDARRSLANGLLRRASITPGDQFRGIDDVERGRENVARDLCTELLSVVHRAGHSEDLERLSAMITNSEAFLRDLDQTIRNLPDAAVTKALAIAASTVE